MSIFCTVFWCLQRKLFQKIIGFSFSTLDRDLYMFGTSCNYFLCSLDPEEYTGNSYSITWVTKQILTQEKHIFEFWLKITWMKLKVKSKFLRFLTGLRTSKRSGAVKNVKKMCFRKLRHRVFQRTLNHEHTTKIECSGYPTSI